MNQPVALSVCGSVSQLADVPVSRSVGQSAS